MLAGARGDFEDPPLARHVGQEGVAHRVPVARDGGREAPAFTAGLTRLQRRGTVARPLRIGAVAIRHAVSVANCLRSSVFSTLPLALRGSGSRVMRMVVGTLKPAR